MEEIECTKQEQEEVTNLEFTILIIVMILALYIGYTLAYWIATGNEPLFQIIKGHWEHISNLKLK